MYSRSSSSVSGDSISTDADSVYQENDSTSDSSSCSSASSCSHRGHRGHRRAPAPAPARVPVPVPTSSPPQQHPQNQTHTHSSASSSPLARSTEDLSPSTICHEAASQATFDSRLDSDSDYDALHPPAPTRSQPAAANLDPDFEIAPLDAYCHEIVDPTVRPSNPADFARLFPSTNRMSIHHDDFTDDGNMNLRVDTDATYRNRRISMQLFHLRMHNLARREFSLRRYCRDSGREVCNTKRHYVQKQAAETRRSVTSAVKKSLTRLRSGSGNANANSNASPQSSRSEYEDGVASSSAKNETATATATAPASAAASISSNSSNSDSSSSNSHTNSAESEATTGPASAAQSVATDKIKLEFSNYARVDIERRQGSRAGEWYEFSWWGNQYAWRRVTDAQNMPGVVAFHLYRQGSSAPLAHLVPETRSPNQIMADEEANGWVPPCHLWISDEAILREQTDHADVIVATGLLALVDDCIRTRWPKKTKAMEKAQSKSKAKAKAAAKATAKGKGMTVSAGHKRFSSVSASFQRDVFAQRRSNLLSHLRHLRPSFRRPTAVY